MKLALLTLETSKEAWFQELTEQYQKKISRFLEFEVVRLKSKSIAREDRDRKKESDSEQILSRIKDSDFVILCDENGHSVNSVEFSKKMVSFFEQGRPRVVVVIGGAYGSSDALKERANWTWSFSKLTFNHFIAQTVAMEQIYRALTIWKKIPYHND